MFSSSPLPLVFDDKRPRKIIIVGLTPTETKVLRTSSQPCSLEGGEKILLSGEKVVLFHKKKIKFIDIYSGATRSLDISGTFRPDPYGTVFTESDNRNIAFFGENGLIVDSQTETVRFILEWSQNLRRPISLIMSENLLALFTRHGAGLTVWNLDDGSKAQELFFNQRLWQDDDQSRTEVSLVQRETMKVAYLTINSNPCSVFSTGRRITFLQRNGKEETLTVGDHFGFFKNRFSYQKQAVIHRTLFLFDIKGANRYFNLGSFQVLTRSATTSQSETRTYDLPIEKIPGITISGEEIFQDGTKFVVWCRVFGGGHLEHDFCSNYKVAIFDFS